MNLLCKLGYNDTEKQKGLAEWKYGVKIKEKKDGKEVEAIKWCRFGSVAVNGNQVVIKKDPATGECKAIENEVVISDKVEINGIAVSYTHLDVYKRQGQKLRMLMTAMQTSR